jgi:hypothetical protein
MALTAEKVGIAFTLVALEGLLRLLALRAHLAQEVVEAAVLAVKGVLAVLV